MSSDASPVEAGAADSSADRRGVTTNSDVVGRFIASVADASLKSI
jgi:hypothetical protein